ncbi:hypothetical protein OH807_03260 [Kitasatospora sp. NBC_01560]|uniref:DUF4190 domain-containing protein n=1 Tax=Kitasatospora sp. NBC_01560 TaxID=2975965 RepID=UPI00386550A3
MTSLVLGVIGFVPPLSLVSFGLSIGAFRRISRRGQRGFGMAVGGLALSLVWGLVTVLVVSLVAVAVRQLHSGPDRGPDGRPATAGPAGQLYLREGDCATDYLGGLNEPDDYHVVPCEQAHRFEVYAVVRLPGGTGYPGTSAVEDAADRLCTARQSATEPPPGGVTSFSYPSQVAWWVRSDHEAICYYTSATAWTGPVKPAATAGSATTV